MSLKEVKNVISKQCIIFLDILADILVNTFVCWTIRNWTIKISSINIKFNYSKDLFYTLRTLTFNRFMDSAKKGNSIFKKTYMSLGKPRNVSLSQIITI